MEEKDPIEAIVYLAFSVASLILKGGVLVVLWRWFIVSHFGLSPITIPVGIGISTIIGLMSHQYIKRENQPLEVIGFNVVQCLMALLIGAIVKSFI